MKIMARVLALVLANKPFTFLQTTIIKNVLLYNVCENFLLFVLYRIENIRIYSHFFSRGRERLDAVKVASTKVLALLKKYAIVKQQKKVPYEIGVLL